MRLEEAFRPAHDPMDSLFYYSALVGGTFLVVQTVMLLLGLGGDDLEVESDVDTDAVDASDIGLLKVLTVKGLVAFFTFFGLTGMLLQSENASPATALSVSVIAGGASMFVVAWLMASMAKLQSKGNLVLSNAIGAHGTVYLRIPEHRAPGGKVHLDLQGRRVECRAITDGESIAVGHQIEVMSLVAPGVLEVRAL